MKPMFACVALTYGLALASTSCALAASPALRITLDANGVARHASPVVAQLTVGKDVSVEQVTDLTKQFDTSLKEADKPPIAAQVEVIGGADAKPQAVIVRWIEPGLTPDKSKTYDLSAAEAIPTAAFK